MELHITIPWLQWYVIPTILSVLFVVYMFWPENKKQYDGPAAAVGFAIFLESGAFTGKTLLFLVIALLSWVIALVAHFAI